MSRTSAGVLCIAACVSMGACTGKPPHGGQTAAPPPAITHVGPVAGPGDGTDTPNPYADNRTALGEGRQLFVRFNCSGCHGGRGGGGMGPSLRDADWLYGSRADQIFSSIVEGRAHGMPSWQPTLTADQMWKLVSYIKSMRTRDEPQAPPTE